AGARLAGLWSDLDAFYARLGFHRAGVENFYLLDATTCAVAYGGEAQALEVRPVQESDFAQLEALYAQKSARHLRSTGELARLARAPDCEVLVATHESQPIAYASMGRGDDLTGVVHEWAGDAAGVGACLRRFASRRSEITLLEGPIHERATVALRRAGARPHPGSFGLMRILDVESLWNTLTKGEEDLAGMRLRETGADDKGFVFETPQRCFALSHECALSLLFGPALPRTLSLGLDTASRTALTNHLPWPLFIWGFDSI
ncbi:MAG: hypothetical protein GY733_04430, partial [bacterium]|nr:hypothetical protein [bacterium]